MEEEEKELDFFIQDSNYLEIYTEHIYIFCKWTC